MGSGTALIQINAVRMGAQDTLFELDRVAILPVGVSEMAKSGLSSRDGESEFRLPSDEDDSHPVALLGTDYPDLHPDLKVAVGDQVTCGQILFTDRRRPRIAFVSPVSGTVCEVERGPRRTLSRVVVNTRPEASAPDLVPIKVPERTAARETLLSRGLWPAFRSRPFGHIPDPEAVPEAIFVTAIDTYADAVDPREAITRRSSSFQIGVSVLTLLTDGPVFICQAGGPDLPVPPSDQTRIARFSGPHPVGLPGYHIDRLHPPAQGQTVWTISCQDVVAIGYLFETGQYLPERIVALRGPDDDKPRVVPITLGARLRDYFSPVPDRPDLTFRLVSGPELAGYESSFLGRYHSQASLRPRPALRRPLPGIFRLLAMSERHRPVPLIPLSSLERSLPTGAPPVPLMRALSVGDVEAAERLGCCDLIEEDVALLTRFCTSGSDYGKLLRRVLDAVEDAA
jgi:Na+-transporting NADH:ubiquinone oxidoreductase subunit A